MVAGRKKSLTNADFIEAALAFADEHGIGALTLKALGDEVGLTQTAVYRYFRSKDEVVGAMKEHILAGVLANAPTDDMPPRARVREWALVSRRSFVDHPCMTSLVLVLSLPADNLTDYMRRMIEALAALGVPDAMLPAAYQALEAYIVGASMLDFSGAPRHLTLRRERYRNLRMQAFDEITYDETQIDAVNDDVFRSTLEVLLDHFEQMGTARPATSSRTA